MNLVKYTSVFKISFAQEFIYRLNFVMWRVRNIMQILLLFFLWTTVFSDPARVVFGYDREKILTYVFGILVVKAMVLSARAVDVPGEISRGDLTNLLLKPVNFFKYWLTRDLSSKALNLIFSAFEFLILFLIFRPEIYLQIDPFSLVGFVLSLVLAILTFFALLMITNFVPFWSPQSGGGAQFLMIVIVTEFLSGGLFPLDILPPAIQRILYLTPFPYLIFFPIQVYLGKISGTALFGGILIALFWLIVLWLAMGWVWRRGLLVYRAEGR
ncbi:MAG: ABC transporter permease [Patescibacteria group bacterium]